MFADFEMIVLVAYFIFLLGLMYAANNIQQIRYSQVAEQAIENVLYNLRDLPRVNYKESSENENVSDNDNDNENDNVSENEDENDNVSDALSGPEEELPSDYGLKRRRDHNPISRLIDEIY